MNEFVESERESSPAGGSGGSLQLPFDPLRLLSGLRTRWAWVLGCGCALGLAAAIHGYGPNKAMQTSTAQLLRQSSRDSESTTFQPCQVAPATLQSLMTSPAILNRVAKETKLPAAQIAGGLKLTPERGNDIIDVEYSSNLPSVENGRVLSIYGETVLQFTRELAAQDAKEARGLLQRELKDVEDSLTKVNGELVRFCKESGSIDMNKEVDAYLRELTDLDSRARMAQMDYETIDLRIQILRKELRAFNGLTAQVQSARDKLVELERTFAADHPSILEQKDLIAELERKAKSVPQDEISAPAPNTTGLAGGLYEELVRAQAEKQVRAAEAKRLKELRESLSARLHNLSEDALRFADIRSRQQALQEAQALISARQREAALYEEGGLTKYRFIQGNTTGTGAKRLVKKAAVWGIAGSILGAILGAIGIIGVELADAKVRTPGDVVRTMRIPVLGSWDGDAENASLALHTWTKIQAELKGKGCVGFTSTLAGEGKSGMLERMFGAAILRTPKVLAFSNGPERIPAGQPLAAVLQNPKLVGQAQPAWIVIPQGWVWTIERREQFSQAVQAWAAEGFIILVELPSGEDPSAMLLGERCDAIVWVVDSGRANGQLLAGPLRLFKAAKCNVIGALLNHAPKAWDPLGIGEEL